MTQLRPNTSDYMIDLGVIKIESGEFALIESLAISDGQPYQVVVAKDVTLFLGVEDFFTAKVGLLMDNGFLLLAREWVYGEGYQAAGDIRGDLDLIGVPELTLNELLVRINQTEAALVETFDLRNPANESYVNRMVSQTYFNYDTTDFSALARLHISCLFLKLKLPRTLCGSSWCQLCRR